MNTLNAIFTDWKLAKRILITLVFVLLFRLGVMITIPGVEVNTSQAWDTGSFIGIMNTLGGGGLTNFSIFALGVSPYITASIIIQLLSSDVIPSLTRLNKQGEKGRIKVEKITRLTTIGIATMQALAVILALEGSGYITGGIDSWSGIMALTAIMVSGSIISLWIADQITMSGVGNGTSIVIMVGIVARIPAMMSGQYNYFIADKNSAELVIIGIMSFIFYLFFTFSLIWLIAFFETSERRLPIQQTGQGLNLINDKQTYMPIKVNPAGVIPVIFASAVISLPGTIAQFFGDTQGAIWVQEHFALTDWFGLTIYSILLVLFTFFYAHININSVDTAESFQKSSTFIIGVTPGEDTERYISKTVTRLSVMGAIELTVLAILPYLLTFTGIPRSIAVGGTSMIILVSVAIDTWEQVQARAIASQTTVKQKQKIHERRQTNKKSSDTILFD